MRATSSPSLSQPTQNTHCLPSAHRLGSLPFPAHHSPSLTCAPKPCWTPKMPQTCLVSRRRRQEEKRRSRRWDPWPKHPPSWPRQAGKLLSWRFYPKIPLIQHGPSRNSSHSYKEEISVPLLPTNTQNEPNETPASFSCPEDRCHGSAATGRPLAQVPADAGHSLTPGACSHTTEACRGHSEMRPGRELFFWE